VWSLVLGIASFVVAPVIGAIAAIITGHRAKKAIRATGDATKGEGMATAGQILGWSNILVSVLVGVLIAVAVAYFAHHKEFTALEPGDCFNGGTNRLTGLVHVVGCDTPHGNETVGAFVYPPGAGQWPGSAGFANEAATQCPALAFSYVSQSTTDRLQLVWVYPGRRAWNHGTRKVVCAVRNADGTQRIGSVK
jgi:Domain of unknown function (DUF4190)/Septum formation